MSDFNSRLPVRTEQNGDVVVFLADGTVSTQLLNIDSSGRITNKLNDGAGNPVTSQVNGTQRALDIGINVAGIQIDPRAIRALTAADVVTVQQGTTPWITSDKADGPVAPGTAAANSMLGGSVYNSTPPAPTNGQQVALQSDSAGNLKVDLATPIPAGTNLIGSVNIDAGGTALTQTGGALNVNVSGGSLTVGVADKSTFTYGSSVDQPVAGVYQDTSPSVTAGQSGALRMTQYRALHVNMRDSSGNEINASNPISVNIVNSVSGTEVNDYNTSGSLAAGGTSNHDYTITASKTFKGRKFWASASGKLKITVQISADGTTFVTKWVGFNSTANPNITIDLDNLSISDSGAGSKIRIIRENKDNQSQDVYSTISGNEI